MQGISGTARTIEFIAGQECEADRLRTLGIATVINYKGFRLWGFETTDPDSIWQSLERVRVFDRIGEAVQEGVFWAIDRGADVLIHAKDSVDGLLLSLKGANVLVGYDVYWNAEKNTKEALTAGKFYLVAEMQNMPTVRRFEVECSFTDKFSPVLMKIIGG
jgi:phage tail sheath protein FI